MKKTKSQALLFVFLILAVIGIIAMTLSNGLQSELSVRTMAKDNYRAFYIAQAGLEYAKVYLAYNNNATLTLNSNFNGGNYTVTATSISGGRSITSTGYYKGSQCRITDDIDLNAGGVGDEAEMNKAWEEL